MCHNFKVGHIHNYLSGAFSSELAEGYWCSYLQAWQGTICSETVRSPTSTPCTCTDILAVLPHPLKGYYVSDHRKASVVFIERYEYMELSHCHLR
jgi:hypothetical protein